jgi:hypothetical protein
MTPTPDTIDGPHADRESVEERWIGVLTDTYSFEEWKAARIIRSLQVNENLRMGSPSKPEIREYITRAIRRHGFEDYDEVDDEESLIEDLVAILEQGLNDELAGPNSYRPNAMVEVDLTNAQLTVGSEDLMNSSADMPVYDGDTQTTPAHDDTATDGQEDEGESDAPVADSATVSLNDIDEELGPDAGQSNTRNSPGVMAGNARRISSISDADDEDHETIDEIREEHGQERESQDEIATGDGPPISKAQLQSIFTDFFGVSECYLLALRDLARGEGPAEVTEFLQKAWDHQNDKSINKHEKRDATAAGVLLQAYAELGLDIELNPDKHQLAAAVDRWTEELPQSVLAVYEAINDGDSTAEAEELRAATDTDEFTRQDLETLVFSRVLDEIERSITDVYITALQSILNREAGDAVGAFSYAWQNRSDAEGEDEYRDGVAAGVGLLAHVSLDVVDENAIDQTAVIEDVAVNQPDLGDAVMAVYEAAVDRTPSASPAELREPVDPERDEFDRSELERLAMADLLELLQGDSTGVEGDTVSEAYVAGLSAIFEDEPEKAIRQLKYAWDNRIDTERDEQIAGISAGVALFAHETLGVEVGFSNQETLVEEIEDHRSLLSDAVIAVYHACAGQPVAHTPEELRDQAETDDPSIEDFEYVVFARLLDVVIDNDT